MLNKAYHNNFADAEILNLTVVTNISQATPSGILNGLSLMDNEVAP